MISRRLMLASPLLLAGLAPALAGSNTIYRNPGCGCCEKWAKMANEQGISVTLEDKVDLVGYLSSLGLAPDLQGCHGGVIDGYVVSGHVPPDDIKRLLKQRPNALGITVTGMPSGSMGMENDTGTVEKFDVLLVDKDGRTSIFSTNA